MIVYFFIMLRFAINVHRTVDGTPISLWKQEPASFFERAVIVAGKKMELGDGLFGRKLDNFHDNFMSWAFEILPMHLVSGFALFIARRVHSINKRWSPAAVTIGVSLFHVFGGKEVTATLGEALERSPPELANGPVRIIVRQPIEYRCSYARPPALVDASHASL